MATTGEVRNPFPVLIGGGLVVGTLDIVYAMLFWGIRSNVAPSRVFQSVAAGVLGPDASRAGGLPTVIFGAVLHYFIALTIVVVYWLASRSLPVLIEHPFVCGAIYGALAYAFMNYVVLPLSAAGRGSKLLLWIVCSIVVHIVLIGIPAALFARAARKVA